MRHVSGGDDVEVTCSGATCTFDPPVDPVFLEFPGPVTVVNGSASRTAPLRCAEDKSHGRMTLQVVLTDELLTATRRQAKGDVRRGTVHCIYNPTETVFTAQRRAV